MPGRPPIGTIRRNHVTERLTSIEEPGAPAPPSAGPEQLLRRLAAGDERLLGAVMAPLPELATGEPLRQDALDRRTRTLVRVAALLALGASTESLRWAVEQASANGADVDALTGVLLAAAPAVGCVGLVESAPRLALALGLDMELDGSDGN